MFGYSYSPNEFIGYCLISVYITQNKAEFWFEVCNFAVGFSVYCLAFNFEFDNHKTQAVNKAFAENKQLIYRFGQPKSVAPGSGCSESD